VKVRTNVVGLNHQNITSSDLDVLLKYPIQRKREPSNKFDTNAVQCWSGSRLLGYIEAKKSQQISSLLLEGVKYEIKVVSFDSFKISIDLMLDGKKQDVPFMPLVDGDDARCGGSQLRLSRSRRNSRKLETNNIAIRLQFF
jgi:hypothetical protein